MEKTSAAEDTDLALPTESMEKSGIIAPRSWTDQLVLIVTVLLIVVIIVTALAGKCFSVTFHSTRSNNRNDIYRYLSLLPFCTISIFLDHVTG